MKKILTLFIFLNFFLSGFSGIPFLTSNCAFAAKTDKNNYDLDELFEPKPFMGIMGYGDMIEAVHKSIEETSKSNKQTYEAKVIEVKDSAEINGENSQEISQEIGGEIAPQGQMSENYADVSLKKLAHDISIELDIDEAKTASDLAVLWNAVMQKSETIKYTIYKLSNPDEDKPNDSVIKKILKPIASFSSVAGASVASDPYMAAGALVGGGLVNAFLKDDKEYNYRFSKVSDSDMVLLIRKIDELQKRLLDLYSDYKTKQELSKMTEENFKKREDIYLSCNNSDKSKEELAIADVYYRSAKTQAQRAKDDYLTSRAILENLVGLDAVKKIEEDE